ncbi:MAG: MBL fold metallo-hydrolase [Anaerolineae bacterium]|nr:MBL fold metallo-hydrolase [Anaerolineae bacterium]
MMNEIKYVNTFTADLRSEPGGRKVAMLLWGDPVHLDAQAPQHTLGWMEVIARGRRGWLESSKLSDTSLLEIYIIDVGQGDAILYKTPAGLWSLIDAGVSNRRQMTGKGAPNFIRWKFYEDLKQNKISLENIIVTHPDFDHYGGLFDLLAKRLPNGKQFDIEIGTLFHSGLPRYRNQPRFGEKVQGIVNPFPTGDHGISRRGTFYPGLLNNKEDFITALRPFEEQFSNYANLVGLLAGNVSVLNSQHVYLPGYEPGMTDVSIRILGPIMEEFSPGRCGLRWLGSEAETINGHSITLRLDYKNVRVLLTGDLNAQSQKLMLSYFPESEFRVNVVKACHHGSADFSPEFLQAMNPEVTIVSSGDNENYAHPQPVLLGASAYYGRETFSTSGDKGPPLLFSTELARSVQLAFPSELQLNEFNDDSDEWRDHPPNHARVKPGTSKSYFRRLDLTSMAADLVYGLVNIRTNGQEILCATMEETGNDFDVQVIKATQ